MKKISLFLFALCVSAFVMGADAPKMTINFCGPDSFKVGTTKLKVDSSFTYNGVTIKMIADSKNGYKYNAYNGDTALLFGKSGAAMQLPALNFAVSKIIVYGTQSASGTAVTNFYVADTAVSAACTGCNNPNSFLIDKKYQAAGNVYSLKVTSAHNAQVSKIEIYEAVAGAPEVPEFSLAGGIYFSAQQVSLTCPTVGAEIQYSYDGSAYQIYSAPLTVDTTQTIYAKAVKGGLESSVVNATYKIYVPQGEGTKANPYTVQDALEIGARTDSAWVTGVIVGCAETGGILAKKDVQSNILICTTSADTIGFPVALPQADIKAALNVQDNPSNKGKVVKVYGAIVTYFGTTGMKNTSDYELEQTSALKQQTVVEQKAMKVIENGRVYILHNGVKYSILGVEE